MIDDSDIETIQSSVESIERQIAEAKSSAAGAVDYWDIHTANEMLAEVRELAAGCRKQLLKCVGQLDQVRSAHEACDMAPEDREKSLAQLDEVADLVERVIEASRE